MHPLKRTGSRRPLLLVVLVALTSVLAPGRLLGQVGGEGCTADHDEPGAPLETLTDLRAEIDKMLVITNRALLAVYGNDARLARFQFRQFRNSWHRADALIAALYPERCTALDLEAGRAEVALLYQDPEDIDTARSALQALSEDLSEIALDPATRMRDEEEGE